jgi:transposase
MPTPKGGSQRHYPDELKERAVRLVFEAYDATGGVKHGVIGRIAGQLGIPKESLRNWVKRAEIDGGMRSGTTSQDRQRIAELERENRELRRSNEILRTASAFFAAELDRPHKR